MSYADKISAEIDTMLDGLEAENRPLHASWVTHAICAKHEGGLASESEHVEFWKWGGYRATREEVRRRINNRISPEERMKAGKPEPFLPGFEHLQKYYPVERNGDEIGVPVMEMTDGEIDTKAAFLRSMGAACFAHADELERFKHWRSPPAIAAQ